MKTAAWIIGIVAALTTILLIVLRIRSKTPWLGPLFWHELVRLARRGTQPRLRAIYAALMLVGLLVGYLRTFESVNPLELLFNSSLQLPQQERDTFTEWFTATYLVVQLLAVALITPVYAGGAIAEEKDRKSLDFLQASLLSRREIVLGKLAARLTFVMGIALVGLPILTMTMLFGGLDEATILFGFIITFFTMLGLAGFSLLMGVYRKNLRDALYWPYGLLAGLTILGFFGMCCTCGLPGVASVSPFTALTNIFMANAMDRSGGAGAFGFDPDVMIYVNMGLFCLFYGGAFVLCTTLAVLGIRTPIVKPTRDPDTGRRRTRKQMADNSDLPVATLVTAPPVESAEPKPVAQKADPYEPAEPPRRRPRTVKARRTFTVPSLKERDPFLWKERYFSSRLPVLESGVAWGCAIAVIATFLTLLIISLIAGVLVRLLDGQNPGYVINYCLRFFVVGSVLGLAPVIGLRAALAVARERQQQTLLSLLMVPEARHRLLWAKWLAPMIGVRYWLIGLASAIVLALITGGLHPFGIVAGVCYLGGFLPFANSYGLWLSVRCHSGTRASTIFLGTMIGLIVAPTILAVLTRATLQSFTDDPSASLSQAFITNLNPVVGLWDVFVGWEDFEQTTYRNPEQRSLSTVITGILIGLIYALLALFFGYEAKRRFDRESA